MIIRDNGIRFKILIGQLSIVYHLSKTYVESENM